MLLWRQIVIIYTNTVIYNLNINNYKHGESAKFEAITYTEYVGPTSGNYA